MDKADTTETFECSGLTISSQIPLSAPKSTIRGSIDVTVRLGVEVDPPFQRPSSDLVAELVREEYLCYSFCRVKDGFICRIPWVADFAISQDLRTVVCHPVVGGRAGVIPVIIPGTITAFLLSMSGQCVLHGSAVEMNGRSIAFVGVSGQGKSTMAAVFCAAGAKLVADDVLPLRFEGGDGNAADIFCLRSAHEIRLREKAAVLADNFGHSEVRLTEDERHAVSPKLSENMLLPLEGIILPRPNRENSRTSVRQLGEGEASLALARCERIEGWRDSSHLRQQFEDLGRVVSSVPVFEVSIPWGPPFSEDLASDVLEACGLNLTLPV
jgi:hypothetical protein